MNEFTMFLLILGGDCRYFDHYQHLVYDQRFVDYWPSDSDDVVFYAKYDSLGIGCGV